MKKSNLNLQGIEWHIRNNFVPGYTEKTIQGMLKTLRQYKSGKLTLGSPIVKGAKVTVGDLLDDLKLDWELNECGERFGYLSSHY